MAYTDQPMLLQQQQPGEYRQLAQAMGGQNPYAQYYQQPQQQQQMPTPSPQLLQQFTGGGGEAGGGGGSGGGWMSAVASNPYTWLAALLAAKAYDTKKHGIGYEEQLKNISRAPISDFDRWKLDKYAPFGGGEIYKSSFELASGDPSNWWKRTKNALKDIF